MQENTSATATGMLPRYVAAALALTESARQCELE